ncbi:MAG: hypothetical protein HWN66_03770 [Candidatus Helarchaeota archaeon]|nr:hypothetical protein [Candidatus Helarchaeota archaeon]
MNTMNLNSPCKFPDMYPDQCHNCSDFRWNYFVHTLKCAYVIRPAVKELLDKKEMLLKELDACFEIVTKSRSTIFKIKNKRELERISGVIQEIDEKFETI